MAKILLGCIASELTGRLGQMIARRTRFGPVVQTAYQVPSYKTEAALAVKARFRTSQNAWSIMRTDLSDHLRALHAARGAGVPGPWHTAMLNYMHGQPFEYWPATNPEIELHIESVVPQNGTYIVHFRQPLPYPWHHAYYLFFHPAEGVDRTNGWVRGEHSGAFLNTLTCPLGPGASIVIIPSRYPPPEGIGRGDAHLLP